MSDLDKMQEAYILTIQAARQLRGVDGLESIRDQLLKTATELGAEIAELVSLESA